LQSVDAALKGFVKECFDSVKMPHPTALKNVDSHLLLDFFATYLHNRENTTENLRLATVFPKKNSCQLIDLRVYEQKYGPLFLKPMEQPSSCKTTHRNTSINRRDSAATKAITSIVR